VPSLLPLTPSKLHSVVEAEDLELQLALRTTTLRGFSVHAMCKLYEHRSRGASPGVQALAVLISTFSLLRAFGHASLLGYVLSCIACGLTPMLIHVGGNSKAHKLADARHTDDALEAYHVATGRPRHVEDGELRRLGRERSARPGQPAATREDVLMLRRLKLARLDDQAAVLVRAIAEAKAEQADPGEAEAAVRAQRDAAFVALVQASPTLISVRASRRLHNLAGGEAALRRIEADAEPLRPKTPAERRLSANALIVTTMKSLRSSAATAYNLTGKLKAKEGACSKFFLNAR